jgi:hypothetical protein
VPHFVIRSIATSIDAGAKPALRRARHARNSICGGP